MLYSNDDGLFQEFLVITCILTISKMPDIFIVLFFQTPIQADRTIIEQQKIYPAYISSNLLIIIFKSG